MAETAKKIKLQYSPDSISDVINAKGWDVHQKLYSGYIKKYNDGDHSDFITGGYELHSLYFEQFKEPVVANKPTGSALSLINDNFTDFNKFKLEFIEKAKELQGSGWIYLSTNGSISLIEKHRPTSNIALIVDLWEHAFIDTFGTNKDAYLKSIWKIIDWNVVSARIGKLSSTDEMRSLIKMIDI